MKNHPYLIALFLFIIVFSCKKEDEPSEPVQTGPNFSWTKLATFENTPVSDKLGFWVNNDVGYFIVGENGYIQSTKTLMKTTDGGLSVEFIDVPKVHTNETPWLNQVLSMYFINESEGWLSTTDGPKQGISTMWKTTDGGLSFEAINEPFTQNDTNVLIDNLLFLSSEVGFGILVPDNQFTTIERGIYRTLDGGETWQLVHTMHKHCYKSIQFVSSSVGYAVGELDGEGVVAKTVDGGDTWTTIEVARRASYFSNLSMFDEQKGFVLGHDIYKSKTGLTSFQEVTKNIFEEGEPSNTTYTFLESGIELLDENRAIMYGGPSYFYYANFEDDSLNLYIYSGTTDETKVATQGPRSPGIKSVRITGNNTGVVTSLDAFYEFEITE